MRILHVTGSFPPMQCGVGAYTHQLVTALGDDSDLRNAVLTNRAAATAESPANFECLPIIEAWNWREFSTVAKVIRAWRPDLVHIQFPTMGYGRKKLPWLLPLCLRGVPVVQTWHCRIPRFEEFIRARMYKPYLGILSNGLVPGGLVVVREESQSRTDIVQRWFSLNKTMRTIPNASAVPTLELNDDERALTRAKYARPHARVIVFFGFLYPKKRVDLLFQIADPGDSHLVIIGDSLYQQRRDSDPYYRLLQQNAESETWKSKVTMAGFLPDDEAARVLAAADAIVLPFMGGAGEWNSSLRAAQAQGTFTLTTSARRHGYDPEENTYYAAEDDLDDMRAALKQYMGKRSIVRHTAALAWKSIRDAHVELYRTLISRQLSGKGH